MKRLQRVVVASAVAVLAGCGLPEMTPPAAGPPPSSPSAGLSTDAPPTSPNGSIPAGQAAPVTDPKDARGIAPCDLLTGDQLRSVGLRPETAGLVEGAMSTETCVWSAVGGGDPIGVSVADAMSLPALRGIYLLRRDEYVFEELVVGGYPAVRIDGKGDNICSIIVSIAEFQAISVQTNPSGRELPDPCDLPRRVAEAVLSNLPPLVE